MNAPGGPGVLSKRIQSDTDEFHVPETSDAGSTSSDDLFMPSIPPSRQKLGQKPAAAGIVSRPILGEVSQVCAGVRALWANRLRSDSSTKRHDPSLSWFVRRTQRLPGLWIRPVTAAQSHPQKKKKKRS